MAAGELEVEIVPFDPATLLKIALFNPAVIVVAVMMGRRADQWQKLIVAGFAASFAGYLLYWLVAAVGLHAGARAGRRSRRAAHAVSVRHDLGRSRLLARPAAPLRSHAQTPI